MSRDIKAEAAEIAKQLLAVDRRCRVCQLVKANPRAGKILVELLAQGVGVPKAARWFYAETNGEYSETCVRDHMRRGHAE